MRGASPSPQSPQLRRQHVWGWISQAVPAPGHTGGHAGSLLVSLHPAWELRARGPRGADDRSPRPFPSELSLGPAQVDARRQEAKRKKGKSKKSCANCSNGGPQLSAGASPGAGRAWPRRARAAGEELQVLVTSAHLRAGGAGVSRDRGLLSPSSQPWRPSGWGAA